MSDVPSARVDVKCFGTQVVVGNMAEEVKSADLPIVHYMLDLWACKVSGKKYLSIHVFFVDHSFTLRHALLSVSDCSCL